VRRDGGSEKEYVYAKRGVLNAGGGSGGWTNKTKL
tara:strand:+ start:9301 stop:9405 length:105 start_codon:yes stop_codon:yes gene_type:complete